MDTLQKITTRESELESGLYARIDEDRSAFRLDKYTLTGFGQQYKDKEIPRTISVTMNKPGVFLRAISSALKSATRQIVVEGLSDRANHDVEEFLEAVYYTADGRIRLDSMGKVDGLWGFVCNHVAHTGPIGARLTWDKDGRPNVLPVDMRYCPFDEDWAANHVRRKGWKIEQEYGILGLDADKIYHLYDYWDENVNEVWLQEGTAGKTAQGRPVKEKPNEWGFVPFVIQFPSTGMNTLDEGYEKYEGESILYLVRDLIPEWNRLMSIQQTKAMELIRPPYVHQGTPGATDPQEYPGQIGQNMEYREGEKPEPLQVPDLNRAFLQAEASMSSALHEGSPNISDLADISGARNASWVVEQTQVRDRIIVPLTQCLSIFYQRASTMLIRGRRTANILKPVGIGATPGGKVYSGADLPDPDTITIKHEYMPDNPHQKLADYSVGIALQGVLSEDTILRDVMKVDDPDGEIDKKRSEEARRANPVIFYYDMASSLIDQAKRVTDEEQERLLRKAKITADSMVEAIKKRKLSSVDQPQQQPAPMAPPKGNQQALLALPGLMGGGNGGGNGRQPQPLEVAG
jgi:hypothetical protein